MVTQSTIFSIIIFDYQVAIVKHNIKPHITWWYCTCTFVHSEQASPISEGVTEIRINSHFAREITWQHDRREPHRYHEWPPFALTIKELGWVLPHTSVIFHVKTSTGSPWVTWILSQCTPVKRGKVSSNSTIIKLLSLWDPINLVCISTQLNACCNRAQLT
jgi:hypothetical protein